VYGEHEHTSSPDDFDHTDDSGIALSGHSRRTSELVGANILQQQQLPNSAVPTTTSLPSVGVILSEVHNDYLSSDSHSGNGYHPSSRLSNGYSYTH
jgi:hypothetical protein